MAIADKLNRVYVALRHNGFRRDAAFLALSYSCGLRRSEAVAIDVADLDLVSGELRVRRGKGRKPRQLTLPPSAIPALQDWLLVRGLEAARSSVRCSSPDGC